MYNAKQISIAPWRIPMLKADILHPSNILKSSMEVVTNTISKSHLNIKIKYIWNGARASVFLENSISLEKYCFKRQTKKIQLGKRFAKKIKILLRKTQKHTRQRDEE